MGLQSSPTPFFFSFCIAALIQWLLCYAIARNPLQGHSSPGCTTKLFLKFRLYPRNKLFCPSPMFPHNIFGVSFFNRILNKHNLGNQSKHNLFSISFCFFEMHGRRVAGIPLLRVKFRSQADSVLYKFTLRFKIKFLWTF